MNAIFVAGLAIWLTKSTAKDLSDDKRDSLALWLMGADTNQNWAQYFIFHFDQFFGPKRLALRYISRSFAISIFTVSLITLCLFISGGLENRIGLSSFNFSLLAALAINMIADYVSLAETRWILSKFRNNPRFLTQIGLLLFDLFLSTAIILLAISAYLYSPFYSGETTSVAEIIGGYSYLSVFFLSTFTTSIWSWSFFLTSGVMKLLRFVKIDRLRLVTERPVRVMASIVGAIVFLATMGVQAPLLKNPDQLTAFDRAFCKYIDDAACDNVARIAERKLSKDCGNGNVAACRRLGLLFYRGHRRPQNLERSLSSLEAGCALRDAASCFLAGQVNSQFFPTAERDQVIARSYREACRLGSGAGCYRSAVSLNDPDKHRRLAKQKELVHRGVSLLTPQCLGGSAIACGELAVIYYHDNGFSPYNRTRSYYFSKLGCGVDLGACNVLAALLFAGQVVPEDRVDALRIRYENCHRGHELDCLNYARSIAHSSDLGSPRVEIERLLSISCSAAEAEACAGLAKFRFDRKVALQDPLKRRDGAVYVPLWEACQRRLAMACVGLSQLQAHRLDFVKYGYLKSEANARESMQKACDLGIAAACDQATAKDLDFFKWPTHDWTEVLEGI